MTTPFVLTREVAQKVLATVDAGLSHGLGKPVPGAMCVEAAVCYALGLPHDDDPGCVAQSLRHLKIGINDSPWSSPAARAEGLRRLAIIQLGTAGTLDEPEFMRRVARLTIRTVVPTALRAAASMAGIPSDHKAKLEDAAKRCEMEGSDAASDAARAASYAAGAAGDAARAANYAARAASYAARAASYAARAASYAAGAAGDAAGDAASDAASYAAGAAGDAASDAAGAASYAARAASYAASDAARAASDAAGAAGDAASRDKLLSEHAEAIVQILIEMNVPAAALVDELAPLPRG